MTLTPYILSAVCILVGVWLSYGRARRGELRLIALMFFACAGAFWVLYQMGRDTQGFDGIGYAIVAVLGVVPFAGGLVIGLVTGLVRRWREGRAHG